MVIRYFEISTATFQIVQSKGCASICRWQSSSFQASTEQGENFQPPDRRDLLTPGPKNPRLQQRRLNRQQALKVHNHGIRGVT